MLKFSVPTNKPLIRPYDPTNQIQSPNASLIRSTMPQVGNSPSVAPFTKFTPIPQSELNPLQKRNQGLQPQASLKDVGGALASGMGQVDIGALSTLKTAAKVVPTLASKLQGFVEGKKVTPTYGPVTKGLDFLTNKVESEIAPLQERQSQIKGPAKYALGAIQSIPQIAPALLGGGASTMLKSIGATSFGSGAREAEQQGANLGQQITAGLGSALVEVATEYLPTSKLAKFVAGKGTVKDLAINAIEEFVGEGLAEALNPFVKRSYDDNAELSTMKQILDAGITGATAAILIGGSTIGATRVQQAIADPSPQNIQAVVEEVKAKTGVDLSLQNQVNQAQLPLQQQKFDIQGAFDKPQESRHPRFSIEASQSKEGKLYREVGVDRLESYFNEDISDAPYGTPNIIQVSKDPSYALGQGENQGILLEFSDENVPLKPSQKAFNPDLEFDVDNGSRDYSKMQKFLRPNLEKITIKKELVGDVTKEEADNNRKFAVNKARFNTTMINRYLAKWDKSIDSNGDYVYTKPQSNLDPLQQPTQANIPPTQQNVPTEQIQAPQVDMLKAKAQDFLLAIDSANRRSAGGKNKLSGVDQKITEMGTYPQLESAAQRIIDGGKDNVTTLRIKQYLETQPDADVSKPTYPDEAWAKLAEVTSTMPTEQATQLINQVERGEIPMFKALQQAPQTQPMAQDKVTTMADMIDSNVPKQTSIFDEDSFEINIATDEPIDTATRVLTELPKPVRTPIRNKIERVYQELISTNVPFEKIGGAVGVQGSNLNRTQGSIEYNVIEKQTNMKGKDVGKSVVDIYSEIKETDKKNFFDYMLNKHNIDRWKLDKPVFGSTVDDITSSENVARLEQSNPEFDAKQKEVTKYFQNLMQEWGVNSGLVSKESATMLNERYPNYVPTYRAKDIPKSMSNGNQNVAQIIKKAEGSESDILPIDQQMIMLTSRTIKNARRNELMNTLVEIYESGDINANKYITKVTPEVKTKKVVDDLLDVGSDIEITPESNGRQYIVNFYTNGNPRQMTVDKILYKALDQSISDDSINTVARAVKNYATNPFKALITGYNPIFAASNIMRDVPTALSFSDNPLTMSKKVPIAVKEMLTNGEKYRMFKAMGGTREGLIGSGKTFTVPTIKETKKAYKLAQKANPIKTIGDINSFTETLPRFSEFLAVFEKTGNPALAVYKSAELTTDFSRHGKLTKLIDNFVPYLNPSVQGIDKFFRSAKSQPIKLAIKGGLAITIPTMILDAINSDDDDYNELSPRERNLYFNIPFEDKNGDKKFVRIPKSRELGVAFSSIYEWAARAVRGQKVTGEEISQTIQENFTPADITAPIWTSAQKAWKQIKDPEAYETNYWGGLIVPSSMRKYSPGEQYDISSSGIAKAIGKQFEISPYVIDYFLKSYGGVAYQFVQPIGADKKYSLLSPLQTKFINDPVFKSAVVNDFYDLLDKSKKEAQDYNKVNNIESKIVTPLEKKANALNKLSLEMSDVRKEQKLLQSLKGKDQEIKKLQLKINDIAKKGLDQ